MSVFSRLNWTPALLGVVVLAASGTSLRAETRSLSFYNTHTQERATIVFKRNGQFDQAGLQELNRMLRDWRRNESTRMDSQLFDLIWEVYRESGSKEPIHIVSGYRSPATNGALRSRSRGVAKFSQHMLGKAMDFYLPDVPLANLRAIGMKKQFGGVGFYPTSGSPFVHMDTGSVRAWPRMSRDQLARLFPDGKTAHLPADGSPLPRYEEALAEVQARKGRGATAVASSGSSSGGNIFASIFGSGSSSEDDEEEAPRAAPRPQELRQGPLPGTAAPRTAVAAATPEPAGETFVPPPPPAPKGPVAARAPVAPPPAPPPAPAPAPVQVAAAPAPGSLVALPVPAPAPRAAGSLVAAAPATANGLPIPPSPSETPPGWIQGPQGKPVAAAATPAGPAGPAARPAAAPTVVAALPEGYAQPRGKPNPVGASAPAAEAIALLTGSQSDRVGAQVLGYAPSVPTPKPPQGGLSSVARPAAGSGIVVAALPPQAVAGQVDAQRLLPVAAAAVPARKGDRVDPLARLVGQKPADRTEGRLMDATGSTRTAAFADLSHPDQEHLPQLLAKPTQLVLSGSEGAGGELRADRFAGPAVVALTVLRTE